MDRQIYDLLKKYYLHFDEKYHQLLGSNNFYNTFWKLWKNEHGGLLNLNNLAAFNPPEILPYIKNGRIIITDTASNSANFQKKYIKTLNELITGDTLNLDFSDNAGGKPQVMIAGLLPIFNAFDVSILSYYYTKDKRRHYDVKRINNKIICISNNNAESIGTAKSIPIKEINIYYNHNTASSAEQSIICLLSLSKYIKINLIGNKSAGYTTVNRYFKLSNEFGIEIPIGYMGTKIKIFKNGL